ncbi:Uncharacterized protein PITC_019740 [Penicillium italicum]|uniref:YEATS domain-containing protein n=1 Tax=Penicillium italicum TaxID=40296 RepID=A0A0A2L2S3_PENIT|nr:Uncharacterized protein PITC_019740 [Penicillium italicum]
MKGNARRTPSLFSSKTPPRTHSYTNTQNTQRIIDTLADWGSFFPHCRDKPSEVEGFPQRSWHIEVWLVNEKGALVPANIFDKVTYHLHPSFGERATQESHGRPRLGRTVLPFFKQPPFRIQEEGWGEFDMSIELTADKSYTIQHDLNFAQTRYESKHVLVSLILNPSPFERKYETFKNPKPALMAALRESGPVPGDENGLKHKRPAGGEESAKKKKRTDKNVDMDKLADGLQKLNEDDLLQVVQMVHDHKAADSYTKNDVELGEFHVDLYTLPDVLIKMLWDFTADRVAL